MNEEELCERICQLEKELSNCISKDKIKKKIKELENYPDNIEEHNCLKADT